MADPNLQLDADGAERHHGAAAAVLPEVTAALANADRGAAGTRIAGQAAAAVRPLLKASGPFGTIAAGALGAACRPVRAILFDKNPDANWSLGWHQDRVICVRERRPAPGFTAWTVKQGLLHVSPPFSVLAAMITLRVHLDPVPADNAPLLIAPGSHRLGRIAEADMESVIARCGTRACLANAGDVWCYATPIVHASARSERQARRRVLQIDYASGDLPAGLVWAGV